MHVFILAQRKCPRGVFTSLIGVFKAIEEIGGRTVSEDSLQAAKQPEFPEWTVKLERGPKPLNYLRLIRVAKDADRFLIHHATELKEDGTPLVEFTIWSNDANCVWSVPEFREIETPE